MSGFFSVLIDDGISKSLTEKLNKSESILLNRVGQAGALLIRLESGSQRSKFWHASVSDSSGSEKGFQKLEPKRIKASVYSMRFWSRISNITHNLKNSPEKRKYILTEASKEFKKSSALQKLLDKARDEFGNFGADMK